MDDSFSFGKPAKTRSRTLPPPKHAAPRTRGSIERSRLIYGGVACMVAAVAVWGFLQFMGGAGDEIAADQQRVVDQIDHTKNVQAQLTGQQAIQAVQALAGQNGSFRDVTAASLEAFEPTFTYTDGPSEGPNSVSVASSDAGVGLAVRSASGACLYAHVAASGITYGTGATCTGSAAMDASDASWPAATG